MIMMPWGTCQVEKEPTESLFLLRTLLLLSRLCPRDPHDESTPSFFDLDRIYAFT